jgi:hypothetical protein
LRRYFPAATIVGVDNNAHSAGVARPRLAFAPDARLDFPCRPSPRDLPSEAYDAIFCMAVLRHGGLQADKPERCDHILPFAAARGFDAVRILPGGAWESQWRYGPDNQWKAEAPITQAVFRKHLANSITYRHMRRGSRADVAFANPVRSGRKQP